MGLNFAWMDTLSQESAVQDFAEEEKRPTRKPQEELSDAGEYKTTSESQSPPEAPESLLQAKLILKRKEEALEEDKKRIARAYSIIQENIKESEIQQAKILKGVQEGEDPALLLCRAVDAISRMTGNPLFYDQTMSYLTTVYGEIFLAPYPLEKELEDTRQRLEKLKIAAREPGDPADKERISTAIRAHQAKVDQLQDQLSKLSPPAAG